MTLPRDLSGADQARALQRLGDTVTRQKGSHIRLTTTCSGEHHLTAPLHNPLKVGTLSSVLREVEIHHGMARDDLLTTLFD